MNRAPEETINSKSPSKHACTGMVGAVPKIGGTGTQRGPVRCPYGHGRGSPNNRRYGHPKGPCTLPVRAAHGERCGPRTAPTPCPVQRPHPRPYGPRTVLPVPVPYRFAPTGSVPFCQYRSRTALPYSFSYNPLRPHGAGFSRQQCLN